MNGGQSMTFMESVKTVYTKYATFSGRASRSEYWWWFLFYFIGSIIFNFIPIVNIIWGLGNFIPALAVACRRLHDTNRSGWWQLLPIGGGVVVAAGVITESEVILIASGVIALGLYVLIIVWLASKGTEGPNRFGDDPLHRTDSEVFA